MISIPITEEAYEALKADRPGIDQAPTSKSSDGQMHIWLDRASIGFERSANPAKAIATLSCGWWQKRTVAGDSRLEIALVSYWGTRRLAIPATLRRCFVAQSISTPGESLEPWNASAKPLPSWHP
jgi:hypothetical protein